MFKAIKNSFLLFFSQAGAYIIPLIELPILTRSLSSDVLGSIFFLQGIILTSSIIVEYGFNYNATRKIAINSESHRMISLIFTKVYSAKIILFLLSVLSIGGYFYLSNSNIPDIWLAFALLQFLGFAFSPYWYFQGMQELKLAVSCDLFIRFLYLLIIVLFVSSDDDALLVVALQGLSSFLVTAITSIIAVRRVKSFKISFSRGLKEIQDGVGYFLFKGGATLLLSLNTVIVGQLMSFTALAIFVSAEKIIKAGVGIFNPIMNAFYPYFCEGKNKSHKYKFIIILSGLSVLSTIILYLLSPTLVHEVLKTENNEVLVVLSLFIFAIPLKVTIQSIIVSLLLPSGKINVVSKVTIISSIILLVFSITSSIYFDLMALVRSILIIDAIILSYYLLYLKRNKLC